MGPRMADYLAAAGMSAGHPNHAPMENCRNIVFTIQMGGLDDAYTRNERALECINILKDLGNKYGGYPQNLRKIHPEKGHQL